MFVCVSGFYCILALDVLDMDLLARHSRGAVSRINHHLAVIAALLDECEIRNNHDSKRPQISVYSFNQINAWFTLSKGNLFTIVHVLERRQFFAPTADHLVRIQKRNSCIVGNVEWSALFRFFIRPRSKSLVESLPGLVLQLSSDVSLYGGIECLFERQQLLEESWFVFDLLTSLALFVFAHLVGVIKFPEEFDRVFHSVYAKVQSIEPAIIDKKTRVVCRAINVIRNQRKERL